MLIDVEQIARVANQLGLPGAVGVVGAYVLKRFTAEGRRAKIAREIAALGDAELLRAVEDDPSLARAVEERRRALAFAVLFGFPARAAERAVVHAFLEEREDQYAESEVGAARRLLRWRGRAYAARSTRADRAVHWILRHAMFAIFLSGVISFGVGLFAKVPEWESLYALAIVFSALLGARQLSLEHQAQLVADDLQRFSEEASVRGPSSGQDGDVAVRSAGLDDHIHPPSLIPAGSVDVASHGYGVHQAAGRTGRLRSVR